MIDDSGASDLYGCERRDFSDKTGQRYQQLRLKLLRGYLIQSSVGGELRIGAHTLATNICRPGQEQDGLLPSSRPSVPSSATGALAQACGHHYNARSLLSPQPWSVHTVAPPAFARRELKGDLGPSKQGILESRVSQARSGGADWHRFQVSMSQSPGPLWIACHGGVKMGESQVLKFMAKGKGSLLPGLRAVLSAQNIKETLLNAITH